MAAVAFNAVEQMRGNDYGWRRRALPTLVVARRLYGNSATCRLSSSAIQLKERREAIAPPSAKPFHFALVHPAGRA